MINSAQVRKSLAKKTSNQITFRQKSPNKIASNKRISNKGITKKITTRIVIFIGFDKISFFKVIVVTPYDNLTDVFRGFIFLKNISCYFVLFDVLESIHFFSTSKTFCRQKLFYLCEENQIWSFFVEERRKKKFSKLNHHLFHYTYVHAGHFWPS